MIKDINCWFVVLFVRFKIGSFHQQHERKHPLISTDAVDSRSCFIHCHLLGIQFHIIFDDVMIFTDSFDEWKAMCGNRTIKVFTDKNAICFNFIGISSISQLIHWFIICRIVRNKMKSPRETTIRIASLCFEKTLAEEFDKTFMTIWIMYFCLSLESLFLPPQQQLFDVYLCENGALNTLKIKPIRISVEKKPFTSFIILLSVDKFFWKEEPSKTNNLKN